MDRGRGSLPLKVSSVCMCLVAMFLHIYITHFQCKDAKFTVSVKGGLLVPGMDSPGGQVIQA